MSHTPGFQSAHQLRKMMTAITRAVTDPNSNLTAAEKIKLLKQRDKLAKDLIASAKVRHKIQRSKAEAVALAALTTPPEE